MDYADSYNVYRKTGTGEWTQIASEVTGVSYKDTTAVTGTKYYYTVCGVSGLWYDTVLSKYNEKGVYGKANLDVPVLSSAVSAGYNSVRLTWGKVSGANGYRIYRSTSKDGQYTCIGAAKKGSLLTFTDKKAIIGTNYYYVVRAYRMVDDSMVKSKFFQQCSIPYLDKGKGSTGLSDMQKYFKKWNLYKNKNIRECYILQKRKTFKR